MRGGVAWALVTFVVLAASHVHGSEAGQDFTSVRQPQDVPCFTGVARLRIVADECHNGLAGLRLPLTRPFDDPGQYAPRDCLESLLASVDGCRLSMVPTRIASQQLRNFSCSSWLQYQGWVASGNMARVTAWVRPASVSRFLLRAAPGDSDSATARGNTLMGVDGKFVVLETAGRCNTTWQVVEGGLLGVGTVERRTVGAQVLPAGRAFQPPVVLSGERAMPWLPRARAMFAAFIACVTLVGLLFLAALGYLAYRLATAHRQKASSPPLRGSPFDSDMEAAPAAGALAGASSLEHSARRHGTTGGL